ncbi:hypothetical protein JD509_06760 [Aeromonas veronii]|uniref:hypothetical protein n=1 Tax=Aeromonas veronii TaxID=654 RepID=UPI00191D6FD9|nr:hypothetical protein [Aeromonas veronii]MBL0445181.1 hypothetical protein [Aeromonas veronii]
MNDAERLCQLTHSIADAFAVNDLLYVNKLIDERLLLLECICNMKPWSVELKAVAKLVREQDKIISLRIESEMNDIQQHLANRVIAIKAVKSYKKSLQMKG